MIANHIRSSTICTVGEWREEHGIDLSRGLTMTAFAQKPRGAFKVGNDLVERMTSKPTSNFHRIRKNGPTFFQGMKSRGILRTPHREECLNDNILTTAPNQSRPSRLKSTRIVKRLKPLLHRKKKSSSSTFDISLVVPFTPLPSDEASLPESLKGPGYLRELNDLRALENELNGLRKQVRELKEERKDVVSKLSKRRKSHIELEEVRMILSTEISEATSYTDIYDGLCSCAGRELDVGSMLGTCI